MYFFKKMFRCKNKRPKVKVFKNKDNYREWKEVEQEVLDLVNTFRATCKKEMLESDEFCREQAQIRTEYCISTQNVTSEKHEVIKSNAENEWLSDIYENLSYGQVGAAGVLNSIINNKEKANNLLDDSWKYIGISCEYDEKGRKYSCITLAK